MEIIQVNEIVYDIPDEVIEILLKDRNTNKNIIFATSNYKNGGHRKTDEIIIDFLKNRKKALIRARVNKSKEEQKIRSKEKAEVFTPSWVCNKQNNLIDNAWFNEEDVFNVEKGKKWITSKQKIDFSKCRKTWEDYVKNICLEVTCGEAPYLTSRYDTVSGEFIPVEERIGLLDRKLRIVSENCIAKEERVKWAICAFKATYAYEFQGDNLLIARENLLLTFIDYHKYKFNVEPSIQSLREIADIISYNIFQMDGLEYIVPFSKKNTVKEENYYIDLFGDKHFLSETDDDSGKSKKSKSESEGIFCKIKDWEKNKKIRFINLVK